MRLFKLTQYLEDMGLPYETAQTAAEHLEATILEDMVAEIRRQLEDERTPTFKSGAEVCIELYELDLVLDTVLRW